MSTVTDHLERHGVSFEVLPHAPTATSLAEARELGVDAHTVAKTVVLDIRTGHAFAVVPADRKVALDAVREALSSSQVRLATEDEIERDYPEFELGAIPPLGALAHTPLIVDTEIAGADQVVFAAGEQGVSVRMTVRDLFADVTPIVAEIAS